MKISHKAKSLIAIALLVVGCSTEKNKFLNRNYHAMTTRYNVYFNGNESFKLGKEKLEQGHKEDYTQPLPLYIFPTEETAKSITSEMDRALEKGEKAIAKHSMFIKKKEYNRWMDENYILMGKAHMYKREFPAAIKKFSYVVSAYPEDPSKYEAMMWMAKTYVLQENVVKANDMFNKLEKVKEFPPELQAEKYMVMTHAHMQRNEWSEAIIDLEEAIKHIKKKKHKRRPTFLLAQLYDMTGQRKQASDWYQATLDLNPDYQMAFYAKINTVLYAVRQQGGAGAVKAELLKMVEQNKYEPFYDQIYYALAEVCFDQKEVEEGIGYLQKSAAVAAPDSPQRGRSYLRISDYYFDEHQYPLAQAYYDSTARFLEKGHPRMEQVIIRQNSLNTLVKNQGIINEQDSLQALTQLDEKELKKQIQSIIDQIAADEEKAREEAIALSQLQAENKQRNNSSNGGNWYFYNTASINFGKSEFEQRWGDRKLEDNWRRSNKSSIVIQDALEDDDSSAVATVDEKKTVDYYMKNLPFDDDAKAASDEKIAKALYGNGVIYREQLLDNALAAEQFAELERRFPNAKDLPTTLYQLYRIYTDMGDEPKQEEYKQKILGQYPTTEYAKIVSDPEYFEKQKQERLRAGREYEAAYNQFRNGYYASSLALTASADSSFKDNPLQPKFDLLHALSYGGLQQKDSMISKLVAVSHEHKGTDEAKEAMRILSAQGYKPTVAAPDKTPQDSVAAVPQSPYKYQPDGRHSVIMVVPRDAKANINQLKVNISNFNLKNFNADKLKVSSVVYGKDKIVSIKSFKNGEKAMAYYNQFKENNRELKAIKEAGFTFYAISYSNYPTFYKEKNEAGYKEFFEANYLATGQKSDD